MNHEVKISTASIGNFVYHGTYETYIGEYLGCVSMEKRDEANDAIGGLYVDVMNGLFNELFCCTENNYRLSYVCTYHPAYYNYETDSIIFNFEYDDDVRDFMYGYAKDSYDFFVRFIKDRYTSRDGFISFTPNNWSDWKRGFFNDDWRCVAAIIRFVLESCVTESEKCSLWQGFVEDAMTIIEEQYVSSDYSVKFDNGFIASITGEWDDNEQATVYSATLTDNNGNIVNTAYVSDAYDDEFHMSAYAAWEYSWLESDLTKKHTLCGTHYETCV